MKDTFFDMPPMKFLTGMSGSRTFLSAPRALATSCHDNETGALAISFFRLLVRGLRTVQAAESAEPGDMSALLRRVNVACVPSNNESFRLSERNKRWVARSVSSSNPFSSYRDLNVVELLLPETAEEPYVGRISSFSVRDLDNGSSVKPHIHSLSGSFQSYDMMILSGRSYLRESLVMGQEGSVSHLDESRYVRRAVRRALESCQSRAQVLERGMKLSEELTEYVRELKTVQGNRRKQKKNIDRELVALKKHKSKDHLKIRQTKERIRELWLNHPNPEVLCHTINSIL